MTTIILTIIGILIAAAAVLMLIFYGGDAFNGGAIEAEAATVMNEATQIEGAYALFIAQEGSKPGNADGTGAVEELESKDYLVDFPKRESSGVTNPWKIDYSTGFARTVIGAAGNADAQKVCTNLRAKYNLSGGPLRCDDPLITGRDPCCISATS